MRLVGTVIVLALLAACGDDGDKKAAVKEEKKEELPQLTMPPLGVAAVKDMNYVYGEGAKAYEKAAAALKKKDWAAVEEAAEEALAKDAGHLDAHRALGLALARKGDAEGATRHLLAALGGDFVRWGQHFAEEEDLEEYFKTPHGTALLARLLEMKADVEHKIADGVWLVGRRSTFKWPGASGAASTRGELYAWDEETRRFLRISHTNHQLAGWLPSPDGMQIALVGYDRAELPPRGKEKTQAPAIRGWVEILDGRTYQPASKRATFKNVRALAAYWGAGGQLLVDTMKGAGRWTLEPGTTYAIDPATGKAARSAATADPASGRVLVSLDETVVSAPSPGLRLAPNASNPSQVVELTFEKTGRTVAVPESGVGDASIPRANPSATRAAFATWADPCAAEDAAKPSLYVADASTGQLKHILTTDSRFNVRWLNDDRLAYEDGTGAIRIWDATTGREATKIVEKAGLGIPGLSTSPRPICRQEPLEDVETEQPGEAEPPLPPEEPGGEPASTTDEPAPAGPVTKPE